MSSMKKSVRAGLVKGLRTIKKAELAAERALKRRLGYDVKEPKKKAKGPYVHPWTLEDPGTPKIVDELKKQHCCGCASCAQACPKGAITMVQDEEGFYYPHVDHDLCVNCGLCVRACPVLQEQPSNDVVETCYAQWSDKKTRLASSSGGMFTELARYALKRGGVVFGAAYDENLVVRHRMIESEDELDVLRGSKYVQSQTGDCYSQARKLLREGRFVLYSGCPCQIAGLYAYLGKHYDNLLTVDLICHGTPSPALFKRYLEENYGPEVKDVKFRDKSAYGWSTHMNAYLEDGSVRREVCSRDPYYRMFLPCLAMRPFCSRCKFTKLPRVADFSIGDWWGIEKYDASLNDGNGTSLVLVNNERARAVFEEIKGASPQMKEFPLSDARPRNYTIDRPFKAHQARERFFKLLKMQPFNKAVRYALDYHFDVGIFGLWYGENYGSILTYFGLVKVIESMGLSCALIANPLGSDAGDRLPPTQFAHRQGFFITKRRPLSKMGECNGFCDAFVVGSDQLWNPGLSRPYGHSYFLSFVAPDRKRVAYGTSFGKGNHKITPRYKERSRLEFSKFDALSVRDDFSKRLLKEDYGRDSVKVLDPALLCDPKEYWELSKRAEEPSCVAGKMPSLSEGGYVFAYLLDPNENTKDQLAELAKATGKPVVVAIDLAPKLIEKNRSLFERSWNDNVFVLDIPTPEQWLYAIAHSDGVVTDSFHGTLFSHVFQKDFVAFPNAKRGKDRFSDALGVLGLLDRIGPRLESDIDGVVRLLNQPVDYEKSNRLLKDAQEKSYEWLNSALTSTKTVSTNRAYMKVEEPEPVCGMPTACDASSKEDKEDTKHCLR